VNSAVKNRASGLTIIELMVALAVLGVLLVIVPPALNSLGPRWRIRAAAQEVAATVQWARNAASLADAQVEILYDVPDGSFWVRSGLETRAYHELPRDVRFRRVRFGEVEVILDVAACRAFPDGTVDAHEVALEDGRGNGAVISFDRLTGEPTYETTSETAR